VHLPSPVSLSLLLPSLSSFLLHSHGNRNPVSVPVADCHDTLPTPLFSCLQFPSSYVALKIYSLYYCCGDLVTITLANRGLFLFLFLNSTDTILLTMANTQPQPNKKKQQHATTKNRRERARGKMYVCHSSKSPPPYRRILLVVRCCTKAPSKKAWWTEKQFLLSTLSSITSQSKCFNALLLVL
jgi:hypothetical protein